MVQSNAIEVIDVTKTFKRVHDKKQTLKEIVLNLGKKNNAAYHTVLENINLNIKKGETVALIGTNGCGKSTLLKMMTKILYPNQGEIHTHGKLTSLLELGAGFHPDFTGRENIYFNASIFGLTREEIDNRVEDIIEFSELGDFIDDPVRTYSSGMYMRLAFSIAINVDAEILLIDEILAVGDQHFQDKCFAKLEELRDSSKTIVIVSHTLDVVKSLCDRVIWIYQGHVQMDGDPITVIDAYLSRINSDYISSISDKMKNEDYIAECLGYIDEPIANSVYEKDEKDLQAKGWVMSEDVNSTVKCFIDGKELNGVQRVKRPDVLRVYPESFGGSISNPLPGWICDFDVCDLEVGRHVFELMAYDHKKNQIFTKKVSLFVKE